ncbi:MAG: hypothetical protein ACRDHP_02835, partial [Ktedonobacterales bacterium]
NLGVVTSKAFAPLQSADAAIQSSGGGSLTPSFDLAHALLVSLAYCVLLVGSTYFIMRSRDITD